MRRSPRARLPMLLTALSLAALGPVAVSPLPAAAQSVKLKLQSGYPLDVPVLGEMVRHFEQTVAGAGRADLRLRLYDAGRLVPTLQIFDAVQAGRIQAGFSWPGYWMGKLPAVTVFAAVPFGPGPDEYLAWIHHGGGLELWRALYEPKGVVPVPCGVLPPEASGWFTKPIHSVDDLAGLKIRFAGLGGQVMAKLGASITMLAAGDIFLALERGVIDATEYSMPAVDRALGFYKVAKHYYFPGWHQPASMMELIVHKPTWDALGAERQQLLQTACDATTLWSLTRGIAVQGEAMEFFASKGVQIHEWSPEMLERFRSASQQVMSERAERDPAFAEAWRSLQAFRERNAAWSAIAAPR